MFKDSSIVLLVLAALAHLYQAGSSYSQGYASQPGYYSTYQPRYPAPGGYYYSPSPPPPQSFYYPPLNYGGCSLFPCQNGATCYSTNTVRGYVCDCPDSYIGPMCTIPLKSCSSSPCKNGGTCTNTIGLFKCTCPAAWTGATCETPAGPCSSNPCQNGGTCIEAGGTFTCNCLVANSGPRCEIFG